jgi:hypothetical protein
MQVDAGGFRHPTGAAGYGQAVQNQVFASGSAELLIGELDLETRSNPGLQENVANIIGVQAIEDQSDGMPLPDRAGGLTLSQ